MITGFFARLDEQANPPRAAFAGSLWLVDGIRALAPLAELGQPARATRPEPGTIERMARLDLTWDARLAKPAADLVIVGTQAWLEEDFEAHLSRHSSRQGGKVSSSKIRNLLMPMHGRAATWFTRVYASATLADNLPIAQDVNAVILDGNGAIRYLAEIESPVVVCLLDRSVADETAAEMVVQLRNTRGEPLSLAEELGWRPPTGVEALGFTLAL
ncbi:hypothetical protein [Actinomadura geliboluensis]|uniref:hypothetical protein n=1 Tax=Actinomadura geliboluensis TaxID=882440 RepID=UPI003710AF95